MNKKFLYISASVLVATAAFLAVFLPIKFNKAKDNNKITSGSLVNANGAKLSWDELLNEKSDTDSDKNKIVVEEDVITYVDSALDGELTLPTSIVGIGANAFKYSKLQAVNFNEGLVTIGVDAFLESSLIKLSLPSTVTTIEKDAFWNCTSLTNITLNDGLQVIGYNAFYNCQFTSLIIPSSVTTIEEGAFINCNKIIGTVTLPQNITVTFKGCSNVKEFVLGNVENIEFQAFLECTSLEKINLPSTLTSIQDDAFRDCTKLSTLAFPIALQSIGSHTFDGCRSLETVTLNQNIAKLGVATFSNCISLNSINIPQSINSIPDSCFYGCSSLTSIDLSSVEIIGYNAFFGCKNVTFVLDDNENVHYVASKDKVFSSLEEISNDKFKEYALKNYYIKKVEGKINENN